MSDDDRPIDIKMYVGGKWRAGRETRAIVDPYRKSVVATMPLSTPDDLDDALDAAVAAKSAVAAIPAYERARILRKAGEMIGERAEEIARTMSREIGKAYRDSLAEVVRSRDTVFLSAEEAVRIEGEQVPIDSSPMGAGKLAFMLRFPVGVVAAITPFNAPFNLAVHKVAPAFAAGNSIVLKAPPQAPACVYLLSEILAEAGMPAGSCNILYGDVVGPLLVADARADFVTFTGSTRVGQSIKQASGLRRVALELGGTGATIVCSDGDAGEAASQSARNAMRIGGQSCISVQNVYVHRSRYDELVDRLVHEARRLKVGDPLDPEMDLGTLVDEAAAIRVENWIGEAVSQGAKLMTGGVREGAQLAPTVLVDVTPRMKVVCEEVFGPVVSVQAFDDVESVFDELSASRFGLQCGIFTRSLATAMQAVRRIRTGGVILNGTSTWRVDQMAYGGIKDSGIGREGPRYAIRDMTDERVVVFNL